MPYYDQWNFVHIEYALYTADQLPLDLLFRQTNEHRILTTRLVLLADAIWFEMRGYIPMLVGYIALVGIAWMLSHLALQPAPRPYRLLPLSSCLESLGQFRSGKFLGGPMKYFSPSFIFLHWALCLPFRWLSPSER